MNNLRRIILIFVTIGILSCLTMVVAKTRYHLLKCFPRIEFGQLGGPVGELTFVQRYVPQLVPSTIRVYKVQSLTSKKDTLLRLLRALPTVADAKSAKVLRQLERMNEQSARNEASLSASIGGWNVEVWSGGQFFMVNNELSKGVYDMRNGSIAPTPEEARKTADAFLATIGPLLTDVQFDRVGLGDTLTIGAGDKPGDIVVKSMLVYYSATIDGVPLVAPMSVRVGAIGTEPAVISINSRLRQIVPDSIAPILSSQEAFGKLCLGEGHTSEGPSWKATVTVKSSRLVYWQGTTAENLSYIMPAYVFEGEADAGGKKTESWKGYIDAIRPEALNSKSTF